MQQIFDYQHFELNLDSNFKTLWVTTLTDKNVISLEFLFELESILAWCTQRSEINAIVFKSDNPIFGKGLDADLLQNMDAKYLQKINEKLQIILQAMSYLPQTIIGDFAMGAEGIATDFVLGMDIRVCHRDGEMYFNHSQNGMAPAIGATGILMNNLGKAVTANILLGNQKIDSYFMKENGLVLKTYTDNNREEVIESLLTNICSQAPVQRIQTKGLINELSRIKLAKNFDISKRYFNASLANEDFKETQTKDFMPAQQMATVLEFAKQKSDLPLKEH